MRNILIVGLTSGKLNLIEMADRILQVKKGIQQKRKQPE
jgi:hypothetical protein